MSKKLCLLMCFVLVLTLSGAAQAWESIDDFNYNLSFEYDVCGVQIVCGHRVGCPSNWDPNYVSHCGVMSWYENDVNWPVVEMDCSQSAGGPSEDCQCKDGVFATDGICDLTMGQWGQGSDQNLIVWQTLDPAYDAAAIIQQDYEYRLFYDTFKWTNPSFKAYLYYGYIADNNSLDVDVNTIVEHEPLRVGDDWQTYSFGFIAVPGAAYIGEPLGIRFFETGSGWYWVDNVRVECRALTKAREPEPANKATGVPRSVTLRWTPGMYVAADVNVHEVYFGTDRAAVEDANRFDETGIYRGNADGGPDANGQYYYSVPETLDLGQYCYWRIDEVNEAYSGPNPPPGGRWKGDVWSFRVTGSAVYPNPEDEAEDVSLYTDLSWTPGTDSDLHDVYFGTDEDAVTDANIDVNFGVYMGRQDANDFDDFVPALDLGKTYYWRIDEVNEAISSLIKGEVWRFTVEDYVRVDDMDSYGPEPAMRDVWKDFFTGTLTDNGAEVWVETDPAFVRDGNSMRFTYRNYNIVSSKYVGSEATASIADLPIGPDWATGGIKVWALYFYGAIGNGTDHDSGYVYNISQDQMYVELEDGDDPCGSGIVKWSDMNNIKEASWHEWNIELADPRLADVNMANIAKVYIGFGGTEKTGQSAAGAGEWSVQYDTVWFDDIRLYPPRCVPEYAHVTGSFRYLNHYELEGSFVSDCKNDYFDLWSMGSDWLVSSYGNATATTPSDTNLMGHWTMDDDDAQLQVDDSSVNANHGTLYDEDRDPGRSTSKHHTDDCAEGTGALTFDGYDDYVEIPALDLNSNTVTISAWIKRDGDLGAWGTYPRIVSCNEPNGASFCFGSTAEYAEEAWAANNELAYFWTGWSWDAHSGLIVPDKVWSFVALVVEPDKGTLYLYDGLSMKSSVNYEYHKVYDFNDVSFFGGFDFKGAMDDVYIYNRALTPEEILGLAGLSGEHYLALEPWRADANDDDKVDFKDYVIMAKNWLKEVLWPFE